MTDQASATSGTDGHAGVADGSSGPPGAGAVVVRIPGPLRSLTDGAGELEIPGGTVGTVLETLVLRHPGLRRHLLTEDGTVRDYVNVFLNEDDVRYRDGVDTPVAPTDTVTIVPSIAGG